MASAVDEVSSVLGLSQGSDSVRDDLKSPEEHQAITSPTSNVHESVFDMSQASMFAARQQLQAKQKGESSSFPSTTGATSGAKKVAAIKPQFKPLSRKQSSFVTPYMKKEDTVKESPPKLSPQRKPVTKQLDRLREASPGDPGSQLPTVSSRYHSPTWKRSRGRHNDESIVSDEEGQKAKLLKKSFTSPERKVVKSPKNSPKPSPKESPKLSPKISSPKSRPGSPSHSPILFHSQTDEEEQKEIFTQRSNSKNSGDIENNNLENNDRSHENVGVNTGLSEMVLDNENSPPKHTEPIIPKNVVNVNSEITSSITSRKQEPHVVELVQDCVTSSSPTPGQSTSEITKPGMLKEENSAADLSEPQEKSTSSYSTVEVVESQSPQEESMSQAPGSIAELVESQIPEEKSTSQTSQLSTADLVRCARETLNAEDRVVVESYNDHCTVDLAPGSENGVGVERKDVEVDVLNKVDHEEECVIEDLLTPLEESLSLPSSSESLVVAEESGDKKGKKKKKSKSVNPPCDEADRQKVNDFFSNKFGMSFSTPKGADRPKPLLKFARKDESDADYSTVQSPGKFKSTFRALGNDKEEDQEEGKKRSEEVKTEKKKRVSEEKRPVRKAEPVQKQSRKVEQKTKRKIERSPKRPVKREEIKKYSTSASSSSSTSSSDDSDSDTCMKRSRTAKPGAKTTRQRNNKPGPKKQIPQKSTKDQKLKVKEEKMKDEVNRKRKKVYSSSDSSDSENEFTLSCTNSDNLDGIWVQCERCNKWRYLRDTSDPNLIPDDWVCNLNPDKKYNNCNAPEETWNQLDQGYEFVYSAYSLGSLVWGKMQGYPWWPGMIDNDPLTRTFYYKHANSQLPDKYHVTFFGIQATRAWIGKKFIKVYNPDDKEDQLKYDQRKSGKGVREAIAMANQAFHLELNDRKKIYGFKEQCKSVEDMPLSSTKAKAVKEQKVSKKKVSAAKKPGYISRLYEKAVLKLSQEAQSTHTFTLQDDEKGTGRGRGRPRKTSTTTEKPAKRKKTAKRSSDEQHYIPTPNRLNSLDVIENIENEINQVLRDCSPSPTGFGH